METYTEKLATRLRDILKKNEDAVEGYETAAENATEIGLRSYFQNKSMERKNFITSFRTNLPNLDLGANKIEGSATGAMHRTWMDVKAFFSTDNDEAMLEEAIKGDKAAIEEYEELLEDMALPSSAAKMIRQQLDWIKEDLKVIRTMEDVR